MPISSLEFNQLVEHCRVLIGKANSGQIDAGFARAKLAEATGNERLKEDKTLSQALRRIYLKVCFGGTSEDLIKAQDALNSISGPEGHLNPDFRTKQKEFRKQKKIQIGQQPEGLRLAA